MGIPILVPVKIQKLFPVNSLQRKFMENLIPISMAITLLLVTTWYFMWDFLVTVLLVKLPITSTRGLLST